jgi:hypothetical protein
MMVMIVQHYDYHTLKINKIVHFVLSTFYNKKNLKIKRNSTKIIELIDFVISTDIRSIPKI